jgi:hypothetical protein
MSRRVINHTLDALDAAWQRDPVLPLFLPLWVAAKQRGFPGTAADLRAQFDERVRQARALAAEMHAVEADAGPEALLTAIRALGGIRPFTKDGSKRLRGDFASLVETFAAGSTWGQRGAASIFRTNGLGLDDLLQQLRQEPRWTFIDTENDLLDVLDDIARQGPSRHDPDLLHYLGATGVDPALDWWDAVAPVGPVEPVEPARRTCRVCHLEQGIHDFTWGDAGRTIRHMCRRCRKVQQAARRQAA